MNLDIYQQARKVQAEVIAFRRDLHRHPEASLQEFRTTDKIIEKLDALGIPNRRLNPTGVVGEIRGARPGKTIVLRADIDALSIEEKSGVAFASENPGMMHACGHDTHTSMLLGAAMILNACKDDLSGTVRLLFQAAEEIGKGARAAIEQGAVDGADAIFGMHNRSQLPAGTVALRSGAAWSAADMFRIKVRGAACHGAMPETGVDATVAAAALVMNLQSIVSRELAPAQPVVVTVGKMESGSRFNIVSGEAVLEGTIRCFDPEIHHCLPDIVTRIAQNTAQAYRCEADVQYDMLTEVLVNDPGLTALVRGAAQKIVDAPEQVVEAPLVMGGEDFAEFTMRQKAAFAMVGVGGDYPWHSDHFIVDEDALRTGVALYAQTALDFLSSDG